MRYDSSGFFYIVHPIIMGVSNAGQVNAMAPALDGFAFIEEHAYAHFFQTRHHADGVDSSSPANSTSPPVTS